MDLISEIVKFIVLVLFNEDKVWGDVCWLVRKRTFVDEDPSGGTIPNLQTLFWVHVFVSFLL